MKLTTTTFVSVAGVMQGVGGPDEDRSGRFERADGPRRSSTPIPATYVNYIYQRADAFLFGRRTYEIFAGGKCLVLKVTMTWAPALIAAPSTWRSASWGSFSPFDQVLVVLHENVTNRFIH